MIWYDIFALYYQQLLFAHGNEMILTTIIKWNDMILYISIILSTSIHCLRKLAFYLKECEENISWDHENMKMVLKLKIENPKNLFGFGFLLFFFWPTFFSITEAVVKWKFGAAPQSPQRQSCYMPKSFGDLQIFSQISINPRWKIKVLHGISYFKTSNFNLYTIFVSLL